MPDPRLVSRAQRAATMLERAWERWRSAHGLAAEPLPPVSSYVGYSIEEPWGRPRVVFGVAAEDAERLAALLQDSLDRGDEADDDGPWPAARGGVPSGPAGTERGNLLEDVRGRIPVQGWPEFSESREQLNSSGGTGPDPAHSYPDHGHPDHGHPDHGHPDHGHPDHGDNGLAAVGGPAGADSPAARADDLVVEDDPRYADDEAEHAAWLSGIRASGDADDDDDEYCDTADDLRATPAGADTADRAGGNGASDRPAVSDGAAGPDGAPGPGPADTGVIGWPSSAGLTHAPRPPASPPREDRPQRNGAPADGEPKPGPETGPAPAGPAPAGPAPAGPAPAGPAQTGPARPGDGAVDRPQDGPTAAAAESPAELAGRTGLTETMAAELAGWAAGELPGQASARLAAWASVGGAVARGRQQARRAGGSTAAERVR
jgi:hypothetical protein